MLSKKMLRKVAATMGGAGFLLLLASAKAGAFALGIPLDGFITTLETSAIGLGLVVGSIGLVGWIGSQMDNSFAPILAGSVPFFTRAGVLGGGTAILGTLGLVSGAMLPGVLL
jgi:hypothetical protein